MLSKEDLTPPETVQWGSDGYVVMEVSEVENTEFVDLFEGIEGTALISAGKAVFGFTYAHMPTLIESYERLPETLGEKFGPYFVANMMRSAMHMTEILDADEWANPWGVALSQLMDLSSFGVLSLHSNRDAAAEQMERYVRQVLRGNMSLIQVMGDDVPAFNIEDGVSILALDTRSKVWMADKPSPN